jgi:hypothetical protein
MIAELVAYAKDKGQSLFDMLIEIYGKFGFYKEDLISITKKGKTGGVIYYELAQNRPDLVLKDIVKILHPEVLPDYELFFFEKLK